MSVILHQAQTKAPVAINDRCFNYGDGFFTTVACVNGKLQLLELHLQRLARAASVLAFDDVDFGQIKDALLKAVTPFDSAVKVLVSRGQGGRGYSAGDARWCAHISVSEFPSVYRQWRADGVALGVSDIRLGSNVLLAGIKHCNRLEQVLVKKGMENQPYDDVIVCDLDGCVVECSASNLFWQHDGIWYTPVIDQCGVDGVMKRIIIERLPGFSQTREVKQPVEALARAQQVFMCNALMGMIPVAALTVDDCRYGFDTRGLEQPVNLLQRLVDDY